MWADRSVRGPAESSAEGGYAAGMGKVDDQRAMREARYAANNPGTAARRPIASAPSPAVAPAARKTAVKPAVTSAAPSPVTGAAQSSTTAAATASPASEETCGHRNIGGRSCTRERGHEAAGTKNHRYS